MPCALPCPSVCCWALHPHLPCPLALQDPNYDLLLAAMFGDVEEFERRMLEPSAEVLQRAKAVGQQIAEVRMRD